jgi:hypothetical protein
MSLLTIIFDKNSSWRCYMKKFLKSIFIATFFAIGFSAFLYGNDENGFATQTRWSTNFGNAAGAGGWSNDVNIRMLADVNGDGRQDVVGFAGDGVRVALSTGNGFATQTRWNTYFSSGSGAEGGWSNDLHIRTMADVNGDGKQDVVGFGNDGVHVALSTGTSFSTQTLWYSGYFGGASAGGWSNDVHVRMLADVNGDGKQDVVGFSTIGVHVALSTGTSFSTQALWYSGYFGSGASAGGWNNTVHIRTMADVNGDGKQDVVGFGNDGVHVALSTGTSFSTQTLWYSGYFGGASAGGWNNTAHLRIMADVNGDGKQDVVGFADDGVHVALSTGLLQ